MKKTAILATSAAAFANAAAGSAAATETKKPGAPRAEDRVAPAFTTIRTDIARPASKRTGSKSELAIELEKLEINASIGLTNKTKKQISSTISKLNSAKENQRQKVDANGALVTKAGEPIKDANGIVVSSGAPVPVMERIKEFEAHDVNPKEDPEKATVRIWRIK